MCALRDNEGRASSVVAVMCNFETFLFLRFVPRLVVPNVVQFQRGVFPMAGRAVLFEGGAHFFFFLLLLVVEEQVSVAFFPVVCFC